MRKTAINEMDLSSWFLPDIDRRTLRELSQRSNLRPAIHVAAVALLMAAATAGGFLLQGSWWVLVPVLIYGNLWALCGAALQHEVSHGTFFRSPRANTVFAHITGFMSGMEANRYRWSHYNHHSRTMLTDDPYDYEIFVAKPVDRAAWFLSFVPFGGFFLPHRALWYFQREVTLHALGRLTPVVLELAPESEHKRIIRAARVHVAIYVLSIVLSLVFWSWIPVVLILIPMWYGSTLLMLVGHAQHDGMAMNVLDHRLNSRSFIAGPIISFLYFHMQWHVEHHLFPQVPAQNLKGLHDAIGDQLPPPRKGLRGCYREILPALKRQVADPDYAVAVDLEAQ
ncbi:MAG: fatty acid desaturase [Actinomycetota bacterium]|nr:fatty acid desaturase [Actinomycetota bacterium]